MTSKSGFSVNSITEAGYLSLNSRFYTFVISPSSEFKKLEAPTEAPTYYVIYLLS